MKRKKKPIIITTLLFSFIVLILWIAWGNTALMVSEFTVTNESLPEAFDGFRIAQVSDLHNAEFGENNQKLLQMLQDTEPDIIVLTGDLVDSQHTDIDVALDFAEKAVLIAPVYYVTGNHEAGISRYDNLKNGLETTGVTVLEDKCVSLERNGAQIQLIGLSDPSFTTAYTIWGDAATTVKNALNDLMGKEGYTILLSHRPELFEAYAEMGVDLVFSGHAHGGQYRLPFVGGLIAPGQGFFPEYDAGLYTDGQTTMVVSRGLGNSILPFRVNNRPEIVVVELLL